MSPIDSRRRELLFNLRTAADHFVNDVRPFAPSSREVLATFLYEAMRGASPPTSPRARWPTT
jgi:hypothetical protein